jgi:hypothetical protein
MIATVLEATPSSTQHPKILTNTEAEIMDPSAAKMFASLQLENFLSS